jgi:hypothetical protein
MKKPIRRHRKAKHSAHLLGLGLDSDGHKRITSGDQFTLVGGTEETHGRMTETVVKTFEELRRREKHLHEVEAQELADILHKSTPA